MEPVSSFFGDACFAPLLTFSSANMLNTTITATTILSRIWRRELSQRAATGFALSEQNAFGAQRMASGGEILRAPA
jgi:hypothetical protein